MSFLTKEVSLPKLRRPSLSAPTLSAPKLARRGGSRRAGRGGAAVVGLELGSVQAIAARGHLSEGRVVADQVVARPVAPDLVRDGVVIDAAALGAELHEMFTEHDLPRRVRVGLATPRTILRVIDVPPLDDADLKVALPQLAQDRVPMPLETAVLDHQPVGLVDTPEGPRLRVIVVATERAAVEALMEALDHAGLKAEGVDLSVFAVIRALTGQFAGPEPVLYAQLGDLVNVAIAESGICHFTRQAPQGLAHVLAQLVERRGGSVADAYRLLRAAAGDGTDEVTRGDLSEVGALLGRVAGEIGSELRAAAEFYGTQSGGAVSRGVVTGALAPLKGFVDALGEASGLELVAGEATIGGGPVIGGLDACVAPVAVGLTVGRVGG